MDGIVFNAVCHIIGKLALFFMIIPAAIMGSAYLIGIMFLTVKELRKK